MRVELSERGRLFLLIPAFLLVIAVLLRQPYTAIAGAGLLSLLLYSRHSLMGLRIDVQGHLTERNLYADEPFRVKGRVRVNRPIRLDLRPSLAEDLELEGEASIDTTVSSSEDMEFRAIPRSRGTYRVGSLTGSALDPLGLYRASVEEPIGSEITVQSSKEALKRAKAYSRRRHAEQFIQDPFQFTVTSQELHNIRRYQPGDPLKNIHWKSTSKLQELMTVEYEGMSPIGCHILLDCSPSMRRRSPTGTTKLEQSIYASMEILKNSELLGHEIGLTAYDHRRVLFHRPAELRKGTFGRIYGGVTSLPGAVETGGTLARRYDVEEVPEQDTGGEGFSRKVGQLIRGSGELVGVLSAVNQIQTTDPKRKLVILLSDLETNPQATLKAVRSLRGLHDEVGVIVPFSPWYDSTDPGKETLEMAYRDYERLEELVARLRRSGSSVFELHPGKDAITVLEEWRGR
ncbi:MAG: DUF58 domain-containing protein [Methanomassiliicoccales archaeon]